MTPPSGTDSIQLIVAKEHECNRLRLRLHRLASWLTVVDRCVAAAEAETDVQRLYQAWADSVVSYVHVAVAVVFRVVDGHLEVVARAGRKVCPDSVSEVEVSLLATKPAGRTLDAEPLPFAPGIDIRRAVWSCFDEWGGHQVVLVAGFDGRWARFADNPDDTAIGHLRMTGHNLGALATRVYSTEALREEHQRLSRLNAELQLRDRLLRSQNELLSHRTRDLQDTLDQLQRAQAELVHRERLGAVGQLAAGVAHEVNNPATFVLSHLEEIEAFLRGGHEAERERTQQLATEALEGLEHIVGIIRELGMFSRAGTDNLEELSVSEMLGVVARLTSSHAKHRAELTFHRISPEITILGRRRQISQVLVNLVMNAIEALPPGRDASLNRITVSVHTEVDLVCVDVTDNGTGVPEHVRPHLFEPFFTTKASQGGSGLGLSIARDIVHEHGGELRFADGDGGGARFVVSLPRVVTGTVSAAGSRLRPGRGAHVLLVDDDPRILRVHERKLGASFKVTTALGPDEGLRILADRGDIDAVLCDLMMPRMNGYELWQRVAAANPRYRTRFIFLTGGIARADLRDTIEAHGFLVSRKPLCVPEVEQMVAGLVAGGETTP